MCGKYNDPYAEASNVADVLDDPITQEDRDNVAFLAKESDSPELIVAAAVAVEAQDTNRHPSEILRERVRAVKDAKKALGPQESFDVPSWANRA